jgi:F0F1-type ATP synthase gamma subunit
VVKEEEPKKILAVPITSDRGLCGGINSNLLRHLRDVLKEEKEKTFEILCIGDKGSQALQRPYPDIFTSSITDV